MALSITDDELKRAFARELNLPASSADWSSTDTDDYAAIKKQALRKFYFPDVRLTNGIRHVWSFLKPTFTFQTEAPYSTGTVTVAAGVVTLTGGTFPSWAANGEFYLGSVNNGPYDINTRDSDTQITLHDTSVSEAESSAYYVAQYRYDLPTNYGGKIGALTFRAVDDQIINSRESEIVYTDYTQWKISRQHNIDQFQAPRIATDRISRVERDTTPNADYSELTTRELLLWPTPDKAYQLFMQYLISPSTLSEAELLGADQYPEVIRLLVIAEANITLNDGNKPNLIQMAKEELATAIQFDKTNYAATNLGYNRDRSDTPSQYQSRFQGPLVQYIGSSFTYPS